jgi:hypothetical protein
MISSPGRIFIPRPKWIEVAKMRSSSYTWGGKVEQKELALITQQQQQALGEAFSSKLETVP